MAGNQFGQYFCVTTFGESHGPYMGCVIDGCPAGLPLTCADIQPALDRRRPGQNPYASQRREPDTVEILSGVYGGKTLGTPIALLIPNTNTRAKDYDNLKDTFRPGHGDYVIQHKYGHRDHRGGGRASARETVARVAAGAVAQKLLQHCFDVRIRACVIQIGAKAADAIAWERVQGDVLYAANPEMSVAWGADIQAARRARDALGAKVYVEALDVPIGWGAPVFEKLDAKLAQAFMSIPAVKAVEIGAGVEAVVQSGHFHRGRITPNGVEAPESGGIWAGLSNGSPITACISFKPPSSLPQPVDTIDAQGGSTQVCVKGRHDPCVGPRAVPIVEAMLALSLTDAALQNKLVCV